MGVNGDSGSNKAVAGDVDVDTTIEKTAAANTSAGGTATDTTVETTVETNCTRFSSIAADVGVLTNPMFGIVSENVKHVIKWIDKIHRLSVISRNRTTMLGIVGAVFVYSNSANMSQLWYRLASLVFGIGIPMFKLLQSIDEYIKTDQEAIRRRVGDGTTDYTNMLTCYEKMELLRSRSRDILSWSLMVANNACIVIAFDAVCSPFKTISIVQFVYFTMGLIYFSPTDYIYRYLYDDPMLVINHSRFRSGCSYVPSW